MRPYCVPEKHSRHGEARRAVLLCDHMPSVRVISFCNGKTHFYRHANLPISHPATASLSPLARIVLPLLSHHIGHVGELEHRVLPQYVNWRVDYIRYHCSLKLHGVLVRPTFVRLQSNALWLLSEALGMLHSPLYMLSE